jgi:hypothetical protein
MVFPSIRSELAGAALGRRYEARSNLAAAADPDRRSRERFAE